MSSFDYNIVRNPEIFMQNRMKAHSDHVFYLAENGGEAFDGRLFLNGKWKFSYAENYQKAVKDFWKEDFDCSTWAEINVPGHIQMQGYDTPQYVNTQYPWDGHEEIEPGDIPERFNPTASYVKCFALPEYMQGKKVFVSFQGVESGFALWVNGRYVGYSEDSFTPSEFDLTEFVHPGENRMAVQVFKWTAGSWCEDQDFFRFSGIFRDVYLYSVPDVHIYDMKVRTLLDDAFENADLRLDLQVWGEGRIAIKLAGQEGTVLEEEKELQGETSLAFPIKAPQLWSAEVPNLYDLTLAVYDKDGRMQETVCEKVGFRRFEIKDSVMLLNGKRIVFKGVNRHEFTCDAGRVMTADIIRKDLTVMKRNNINAVRTCHYPNISAFYRLCDEIGLYVIDESNMETHGVWDFIIRGGRDISFSVPGDRPEFLQMVLDRANSMYQRDKNHACILIWSCGNESYGGTDILEIANQFRRLDETRPVHYEGIHNDGRYPDSSDIWSQMYPPVEAIKEFIDENRDKPFICCEYAHAMGNSCGALHKYTEYAYEEELYQGGFIWDYIDQCLTRTDRYGNTYQGYGGDFGDRPADFSFSGNGIVYGENREPSPKMQEVKYCYRNIEVSFVDDELILVNRNLFVDIDRYDCIVSLMRDGEEISRCVRTYSVAPLSEGRFPLDVSIPEEPGEYCVTVSFVLKESCAWAEAGHEVAFGQKVVRRECAATGEPEKGTGLTVIHGWNNIGVRGENFEVLFSCLFGGMVSYKYEGRQLIQSMPKPNFWRAMTENDMANLQPMRSVAWKTAGMFGTVKTNHGRGLDPYKVEEKENSMCITYTYHLPVKPQKDCALSYEVFGDGTVRTTLRMDRSDDVGELPEFSVLFMMDPDFDHVKWYGPGPEETYVDRCHGGKLGIYENRVKDNMAKYLVPQECGNKVDIRWASVTDEAGHGLLFITDGLQFSTLPYTPHELDNAAHPNELPPVQHTCVRVGCQMGIGGDDTWGALVHPEYLLDNSKEMKITFCFKGM